MHIDLCPKTWQNNHHSGLKATFVRGEHMGTTRPLTIIKGRGRRTMFIVDAGALTAVYTNALRRSPDLLRAYLVRQLADAFPYVGLAVPRGDLPEVLVIQAAPWYMLDEHEPTPGTLLRFLEAIKANDRFRRIGVITLRQNRGLPEWINPDIGVMLYRPELETRLAAILHDLAP